MTPELLGDAALLASEVVKGVVEELLGAIMIVLRKRAERREVIRPLWWFRGTPYIKSNFILPLGIFGLVIRRS